VSSAYSCQRLFVWRLSPEPLSVTKDHLLLAIKATKIVPAITRLTKDWSSSAAVPLSLGGDVLIRLLNHLHAKLGRPTQENHLP